MGLVLHGRFRLGTVIRLIGEIAESRVTEHYTLQARQLLISTYGPPLLFSRDSPELVEAASRL
jgi:hypothetical protein